MERINVQQGTGATVWVLVWLFYFEVLSSCDLFCFSFPPFVCFHVLLHIQHSVFYHLIAPCVLQPLSSPLSLSCHLFWFALVLLCLLSHLPILFPVFDSWFLSLVLLSALFCFRFLDFACFVIFLLLQIWIRTFIFFSKSSLIVELLCLCVCIWVPFV